MSGSSFSSPAGVLLTGEAMKARFDRVADLVERSETPYGLELLSTVHWICSVDGLPHLTNQPPPPPTPAHHQNSDCSPPWTPTTNLRCGRKAGAIGVRTERPSQLLQSTACRNAVADRDQSVRCEVVHPHVGEHQGTIHTPGGPDRSCPSVPDARSPCPAPARRQLGVGLSPANSD